MSVQNIPELTEALKTEKENVMFGTLECWLLFKLSGDKKLHFSTYSNAAATGISIFLIKGGLISDFFSFWLRFQKIDAKSLS